MARDEGAGAGSILLAFILGAVSGAAVALLYAPATGRETREYLGEKAREGRARAAEAAEKGRDAIKQMWGSLAQSMGLKDVRLDTLDLELAGDTGCEVGEATITHGGGTAVVKFVVVWKKTDGQWRLHRDIWNAKG